MDRIGRQVFRTQPDDTRPPWGPEPTKLGDRWGYKDTTGAVVIWSQFDEAYSFFYGLAPVKTGGEWGYVDKAGTYVWQEESRQTK